MGTEKMAFYDGLFNAFGLRDWCDQSASTAPMSMADLLKANNAGSVDPNAVAFPSHRWITSTMPALTFRKRVI